MATSTPPTQAQQLDALLVLMDDVNTALVAAAKHHEAFVAQGQVLTRGLATLDRLETAQQSSGTPAMLEDILHVVSHQPTPPWWQHWPVLASAVTLAVVLGLCVGWATKPQLFLSPHPQIVQQMDCKKGK